MVSCRYGPGTWRSGWRVPERAARAGAVIARVARMARQALPAGFSVVELFGCRSLGGA